MKYVTNYLEDANLFLSFNELAKNTFSIDFLSWKNADCSDGSYIPHSFVRDGKIIANVSVTQTEMIIDQKAVKGVQIGTVMTDPSFRGHGLSRKLIEAVLEKYSYAEFIYLFANDSVLDFYPKFGFVSVDEFLYCNENLPQVVSRSGKRRLNARNAEDIYLLKDLLSKRNFQSVSFGVKGSVSIPLWHFLNTYTDAFYYIAEIDCVAVYSIQNDELLIYDIISESPLTAIDAIPYIIEDGVKNIIYHFVPDKFDPHASPSRKFYYDRMFYLGKNIKLPEKLKYPAVYTA